MSAKFEQFLPHELQFATAVDENNDLVAETLEYSMASNGGDIVDAAQEVERDFRRCYLLCEALVYGTPEYVLADTARAAVGSLYRGMLFGMQVADAIEDAPTTAAMADEYFAQKSAMTALDRMVQDVQEYVSERPAIDDLLTRYSEELDPGRQHTDLAEAGAGFMLMMCEREQAELYVHAIAQSADPTDFER